MSYKIGSFNVKNLSCDNRVNLETIAEIIKKENFDVIVFQEVLRQGMVLKTLMVYLGKKYDVRWGMSDVNSGAFSGDRRGEGYAFVWNKSRLELPTSETEYGIRVFEPRIWHQYSLNRTDGKTRLVRDPFYGRFRIKHLQQEFRLIVTHIRFSSNEEDSVLNESTVGLRRSELRILAGSIYPSLHDKIYGNKDGKNKPATTLLLGDYNLNLAGSGAGHSYMDEYLYLDKNNQVVASGLLANRAIRTGQKELSTLMANETGYRNNYDHFSYEEGAKEASVIRGSKVLTVEYMKHTLGIDIDFETYRKDVSDHLPICIEIAFRKEA